MKEQGERLSTRKRKESSVSSPLTKTTCGLTHAPISCYSFTKICLTLAFSVNPIFTFAIPHRPYNMTALSLGSPVPLPPTFAGIVPCSLCKIRTPFCRNDFSPCIIQCRQGDMSSFSHLHKFSSRTLQALILNRRRKSVVPSHLASTSALSGYQPRDSSPEQVTRLRNLLISFVNSSKILRICGQLRLLIIAAIY